MKGMDGSLAVDLISNLILIDADMRRRAAISHALSSGGIHVEPFENISELAMAWPRSGVVLIHDQAGAIDELIESMASHSEWFPIIAFSEEPGAQRIVQAILDGAIDYIAWPISPEELTDSLAKAITRAESMGNAKLREVMARARVDRLTRREREVLGGVASGLSNRLIGESSPSARGPWKSTAPTCSTSWARTTRRTPSASPSKPRW